MEQKLSLKKYTLARLDDTDLKTVVGGTIMPTFFQIANQVLLLFAQENQSGSPNQTGPGAIRNCGSQTSSNTEIPTETQ